MMKNYDIKKYIMSLFIALRHVHKYGIVHRDIKPSNFIYCHTTRQ